MSCSRRAKQATINRLFDVGIITLLRRFTDNTSYNRSFWSDYWQVSKEYIKQDKRALPDLFKAIRCELGL